MKIDLNKKLTAKEKKELAELNRKAITEMVSRAYRHEYEETEHPLFLMKAYKFYRERKEPVPEWIMTYFDSVSDNLLQEAQRWCDGKKNNSKDDAQIKNILGMSGKGKSFRGYAEIINKFHVIQQIAWELIEKQPEILDGQRGRRAFLKGEIIKRYNFNRPESESITDEFVDKWIGSWKKEKK